MPAADEFLTGILDKHVEEETKANEAHAATVAALNNRVSEAQQRLFEKIMPKRPEVIQWPPEVIAIANALTAQPRLIPLVDSYVKKLVTAVNDAVTKVLTDAMPVG